MKYQKTILGLTMFMSSILVTTNSQAQNVDSVYSKIDQIESAVSQNSYELSRRDIRNILNLLDEALYAARSPSGGGHGGGSSNACQGDYDFQNTFIKMKNFAYASDGVNLSSTGAQQWAHQWTSRYSCSVANQFISEWKVLRQLAYASDGMNMSSQSAINYAESHINSFCGGNVTEEFKRHRSFAYSSTGLNYSSSQAIAYATENISYFFNCNRYY